MGVIRGTGLIVLGILLVVSLLVGNFFWTLSWSLNADVIQGEAKDVIKEFAMSNYNLGFVVTQNYQAMIFTCENNSEVFLSESQIGYDLPIPCEIVDLGTAGIIDYGVDALVDDVYYKQYDCKFWSCFKSTSQPFFLISEYAKNYYKGKFYWMALISILLTLGILALSSRKSGGLLLSGIIFIVAALPFLKLDLFFSSIFGEFSQFSTIVFSKSVAVFIMGLVIGIVLIGFGIWFKFLKVGTAITEKIEKTKMKSEIKELKKKVETNDEHKLAKKVAVTKGKK
jgi:hypothetical protein